MRGKKPHEYKDNISQGKGINNEKSWEEGRKVKDE